MTRTLFVALCLMALPASARPVRVCVVGDSISAGFFPATVGWYVYLRALNPGSDFGVKSVAVSGHRVADAQTMYGKDVRGRGCTHVAILVGTNDLFDGTASSTIWQGASGTGGIKSIVDAARADGSKVLLLAILPRGTGPSWTSGLQTRLEAVNASMSAYANGSTIIYVDTYTALLEPASSPPALATAAGGATDGLHPNDAGELLIATTVHNAVVAAGGW